MPPSSPMPTQMPTPTSPEPKNTLPYLLIALSVLMAVGLAIMYVKVDLLTKNLNQLSQQIDQKTPTSTPETSVPNKTPPPPSIATVVYTDPTTGLRFAVPNNYGPENYSFTKESIAGTELVSRISVKRAADGNIPECSTIFTISSVGGPTSAEAVLITDKYLVVAPAVDCEITVQEGSSPTVTNGVGTFTRDVLAIDDTQKMFKRSDGTLIPWQSVIPPFSAIRVVAGNTEMIYFMTDTFKETYHQYDTYAWNSKTNNPELVNRTTIPNADGRNLSLVGIEGGKLVYGKSTDNSPGFCFCEFPLSTTSLYVEDLSTATYGLENYIPSASFNAYFITQQKQCIDEIKSDPQCKEYVAQFETTKLYSRGNFTFSYPAKLAPTTKQTNPQWTETSFTDSQNVIAFRLTCPLPEMGFEAWNFKTQKRSTTKDGKTYDIQLMLGTALPGSGLGDLNLILMQNANDATLKDSCMLTSDKETNDAIYQKIYSTIR